MCIELIQGLLVLGQIVFNKLIDSWMVLSQVVDIKVINGLSMLGQFMCIRLIISEGARPTCVHQIDIWFICAQPDYGQQVD
jgi:hypothetical protein